MKFKSVDIAGFRSYAYEGDGAFNFCHSDGSVSNFISIYAPNGFGKSSFYDAIEWAITNNISRYIRDSQRSINHLTSLSMNTSYSAQRILRNRYISEDSPAYVIVETTGKTDYRKNVRRPAPGQRDYTYDPSKTDQKTKHLSDIFLSQDAIDAFLKEDRPEQRYERFMIDFGGNDEKYRATLFSLIKSCNREIAQLNDAISDLQDALEEPSLEFSVDSVNKTIQDLNALGHEFSTIDSSFSELAQTELHSVLSMRVVELESTLNALEARRKLVSVGIESLPRLAAQRSLREMRKREIKALRENRDKIEEVSKANELKKELEGRLKLLIVDLGKVQDVVAQRDLITNILNTIKELEGRVLFLKSKLSDESVTFENHNKAANLLREQRLLLDRSLASLSGSLRDFDSRYSEMANLDALITGYKQKIGELNLKQTTVLALQNSLEREISNISALPIGYSSIPDEVVILLKPESQFVANFHNQIELQSALQLRLKQLDEQAKSLGSQSNELFEVLELTRSLLAKTLSDSCPVCNAKYDSHSELLDRVQQNEGMAGALNLILVEKRNIESQIAPVNDFLKRGIDYLNSLKSFATSELSLKMEDVGAELKDILLSINAAEQEVFNKSATLHDLKANVRNLNKEDYVAFVTNSKSELVARIERVDVSLQGEEIAGQAVSDRIQALNLESATLENQLNTQKGTEIFLLYTTLKVKYIISDDDFSTRFVEKERDLTALKEEMSVDISRCNQIIEQNEREIIEGANYSSVEPLAEKLRLLDQELNDVETTVAQLEVSLRMFVPDGTVSNDLLLESLSSADGDILNQLRHSASVLLLCNILQAQLVDVLPFVKYRKMREEIAESQAAQNKIRLLIVSLSTELRTVEGKLKRRIDGFFYTDLITSIYRKIDPHPFFKIVRFECVFPEDERPRLEVYLYEDGSTQPISPGLYFSSAQLNILSLSIFLAKALHIEHDGEPVRSILIDDPIQSMDSINILSVIDLLRNISVNFDRQIILSTHDENFYELLKLKVPEEKFGSKFIRFKSFGVVVQDEAGHIG